MIANVAEPIWVKFSGIVEDRVENDLAKEFFEKIEKYKSWNFWQPCTVVFVGLEQSLEKVVRAQSCINMSFII